jgi:hypothetical protein
MSPLAEAMYAILRLRLALSDPRITYAELAKQLRESSDEFEFVYHRSRELYAALAEIGRECRRQELPPLPALVVRADTGRPGDAYYATKRGVIIHKDDRVAAWKKELEAVQRTTYPAR